MPILRKNSQKNFYVTNTGFKKKLVNLRRNNKSEDLAFNLESQLVSEQNV